VDLGKKLLPGKIYDSNRPLIEAALKEMGITPILSRTVPDNEKLVHTTIQKSLRKCDVIILMGGVSVGDYDFVKGTLKQLGVREIFWKVRQKPGKPLYFGKKNKTLVFGLPGNPASVFMCFYQYVYPALRQLSGRKFEEPAPCALPLAEDVRPAKGRLAFLKGKIIQDGGKHKVKALGHQASHMLSSLTDSNCIIEISIGTKVLKKGTQVKVYQLPS